MRRLTLRSGSPLESARHDWVVLGTVIAAVVLLIGNGTSFFREISRAEVLIGPGIQVAAIALTLNVALILFGWRRYVDLQHETERRLDGERRAAIAASTALPPARKTSSAVSVACGCEVAAMPFAAIAAERLGTLKSRFAKSTIVLPTRG